MWGLEAKLAKLEKEKHAKEQKNLYVQLYRAIEGSSQDDDGGEAAVQAALAKGADINYDHGRPLRDAVDSATVDFCKRLIELGAKPRLKANVPWERSIAYAAAGRGNVAMMQWVLSLNPAIEGGGWTAIGRAAAEGYTQIINLLLQHGASLTAGHYSPFRSAFKGGHLTLADGLARRHQSLPSDVLQDCAVWAIRENEIENLVFLTSRYAALHTVNPKDEWAKHIRHWAKTAKTPTLLTVLLDAMPASTAEGLMDQAMGSAVQHANWTLAEALQAKGSKPTNDAIGVLTSATHIEDPTRIAWLINHFDFSDQDINTARNAAVKRLEKIAAKSNAGSNDAAERLAKTNLPEVVSILTAALRESRLSAAMPGPAATAEPAAEPCQAELFGMSFPATTDDAPGEPADLPARRQRHAPL